MLASDIIDIKKEGMKGASLATAMTRRQFDRRPHTRLFISNPAHHPPSCAPPCAPPLVPCSVNVGEDRWPSWLRS